MAEDEALRYATSSDWKLKVKRELKRRGRGAQAAMAREIGISTGALSELLTIGKFSVYVPRIHKYLGWEEPMPPLASRDVPEIQHIVRRLSPRQRQRLSLALADMSVEQVESAIEALVAMSGVSKPHR